MKHHNLILLSLAAMCLLAGCNRNNETKTNTPLVESAAETESESVTPQATSYWDIIEDSLYTAQTSVPGGLTDEALVKRLDSLVTAIGRDSGWVKPYAKKIRKEFQAHKKQLLSFEGSPLEIADRHWTYTAWQRYFLWRDSRFVQQQLDRASIPINIQEEYALMDAYRAATFELFKIQDAGWGDWMVYHKERSGLYMEMARLVLCYQDIARDDTIKTHYSPIDDSQFENAFQRLAAMADSTRSASKGIQKAYTQWMDYRAQVSQQLDGNAKAQYDNATNALQRHLLIEIKNRYENYWMGSMEPRYRCLPPNCTHEQLLAFRN